MQPAIAPRECIPNGIFPYEQNEQHDATGGCVIFDEQLKPGAVGSRVYLNCTDILDAVLARVLEAGGQIVQPKINMPFGSVAFILDTEGNQIGLHAY